MGFMDYGVVRTVGDCCGGTKMAARKMIPDE
jgi:hypothetical protein